MPLKNASNPCIYLLFCFFEADFWMVFSLSPKIKISIQTFHNCSSLTSVELSKKLRYIGELAFENCQSLKEIYIPETVKTIRGNAFEGCSSLTILSNGGDYAERFAKKNKISYKRI
jgi:hypothetical protein